MEMIYRLTVDDQSGVLDRIVGLVRRHAQNISFLLVYSAEHEGQALLHFKLVGGIVDSDLSRRIAEIDSVRSLEVAPDTITEKIMKLGG